MGNRICLSRRITVEERFTRPHRLVRQPSNVDYKKLRKLILSQKLAPCFDGVEDCNSDLEECPICFFFYPSLNRSRCCTKGICTECFLQMNPSSTTRSAQCPFCKTQSYAVEFRGPRTQEEKGREQVEEQRVIEAKIRMQLEESQNEDRVTLANRNSSISDPRDLSNGEEQDLVYLDPSLVNGSIQDPSFPLNAWNERREEYSLDLEEIMMVEAILLSIQDQSIQKSTTQKFSRSTVIDETHSEAQIPVSDEISIEIARPNLLQPNYGSDNNTNGRDEMVQDGEFGSSIDDPNLEEMEGGILESPSSRLMKRNQCPENGSLSHVDVESSNLSSDVSCGSPYRSDIGRN